MLRITFLYLIHFSTTILILKSLNFILPNYFSSYFFKAANFLLCVVIAKFTFGYVKQCFNEKLKPDGKAVLITGCARGFGKRIAQHLDSKGFHVFASCLNPDSPGAKDLKENSSSRLQLLQLDVKNDESVEKAAQFVKANLGSSVLWAIINNAGIQNGFLTELTSIRDFKDSMEVNAIGHVRVTKAFLPLLLKSRGRVINIASIAGRITLPMCGAYTMSKFASIGFSESLRLKLSTYGIRVISIEPEIFETDMATGENIMKRVDETFSSADENVRKDYGEDFIRKYKIFAGKVFPPSPNMQKVLEDIERAVTLKNPDAVYQTFRNIFVKVVLKFYEACPVECQVFMVNTYYRAMGFGKPAAANKVNEKYHCN